MGVMKPKFEQRLHFYTDTTVSTTTVNTTTVNIRGVLDKASGAAAAKGMHERKTKSKTRIFFIFNKTIV